MRHLEKLEKTPQGLGWTRKNALRARENDLNRERPPDDGPKTAKPTKKTTEPPPRAKKGPKKEAKKASKAKGLASQTTKAKNGQKAPGKVHTAP